MKKILFLLLLSIFASCSKQDINIEQEKNNSESWISEEKTISQKHNESLGWLCACASCMWLNTNQKDEFIL